MRYYFKGHIVELVNDNIDFAGIPKACTIRYVARPDGGKVYPYEMVTNSELLEPLVAETYNIGDYIKTKHGDYVGVIIGFEPHSNSVVSAPVHITAASMQHVRYSHRATQIEIWDATHIHIRPGKFYEINHTRKCLAVKVTNDTSMIVTVTGELVTPSVPAVATKEDLLAAGIQYIKEIKI